MYEAGAAEAAVSSSRSAPARSGYTTLSLATISSIVPHITLAPKTPLSVLPSATAAAT